MSKRSFRPDSVQIGVQTEESLPNTTLEASQLGQMVEGQFVVRNSGPSQIPTLKVDILWPSMQEDTIFLYPSRVMVDSGSVSNMITY